MANPKYTINITSNDEEWGNITIETLPDVAPLHAENFDNLVKDGSYDGCAFHRVIPGFMIQGGDPNSISGSRDTWGFGNPKQKNVKAEFNDTKHDRGIISAARSQNPNSASSQFFICVADAHFLDRQYSAFGKVIDGMDLADKIVAAPRDNGDNPHEKIVMKITRND
ncbi:peptidylprolyl isomerase [Candidatus Kapabacteria bacterium]|nr:peptidylprolyl isomerase [Candidatus Kapabacteria bacterium]